MRKLDTVEELVRAYHNGELTENDRLILDNDDTFVYTYPEGDNDYEEGVKVFECHPNDLLRALLDHVGIHWDEC